LVGAKIQVLKIAVKQVFDVVISLVFLLLTAPLLCLTALAIFLEDGRPIFYREERFGLNGRCFDVIKFRTMWVDAEKDGVLHWAAANDLGSPVLELLSARCASTSFRSSSMCCVET